MLDSQGTAEVWKREKRRRKKKQAKDNSVKQILVGNVSVIKNSSLEEEPKSSTRAMITFLEHLTWLSRVCLKIQKCSL
ncbi:hypothetical protein TNCT_603491 [Trichonephila clavata]|uniref:Uncharacterized protein n=1 Tax=Trichonephila clavata TaxID=2740835 RepID=A0A8X6GHS9_TRICU|nr:hypothetical protein TNCT_603491 [Trichonephila clavata]